MGNPIYILAGQSNATAMRQEFETAIAAALGNATYHAQTVTSGGAPLTWQRAKEDWHNDTELRNELYDTISDALNADPDAYLAGIIWVQGEADTYPIARADEYAQELQGLIQDIRDNLVQDFAGRDTHHDTFDFVISGLSQNAPDAGARENWETVRAQQALLAQSSADIQLINPDSIAQSYGYNIDELFKDGLHYSNPFQTPLMNALVANLLALDNNADTLSNPVHKNVVLGSSDGEKLYGSNGDDIIYGGAGWDHYKGRGGNDTFVFTDEDTRWGERVIDFEDTKDDILIDTQTVLSFDDLDIFEHATLGGTVVNYGAGSFVLLGIDPSQISASDFDFI
jgi:Ca2+-binding RTX toxin-like protein